MNVSSSRDIRTHIGSYGIICVFYSLKESINLHVSNKYSIMRSALNISCLTMRELSSIINGTLRWPNVRVAIRSLNPDRSLGHGRYSYNQ